MVLESNRHRRTVLKTTGIALASSFAAGCLGGQDEGDYPQEDITIVIPYGGGGFEEYPQLMAPYLSDHLPNDVDVIVENQTGGGGTVATTEVYNADPDGYTIMTFNNEAFPAYEILERGDYNSEEMTFLPTTSRTPSSLAVSPDSGIESWDDYVSGVNDEEVTFGATSGVVGTQLSVPWLVGDISGAYPPENVLNNFVEFDGVGEIAAAMERGDVDVWSTASETHLNFEEQVDIIFVFTGEEEHEYWPDAQTIGSVDIEEANLISERIGAFHHGYAGPPDMPEETTETLRTALTDAITDEEFQADAEDANRPVTHNDSEYHRNLVETYADLWQDYEDLIQGA